MDAEVMKKLEENINNESNEKSEEECKKERFFWTNNTDFKC